MKPATGVTIYDTTLRDGAQGRGVSFSVADKIDFTRELDRLGLSYVEGGWPASNPRDAEFFSRIRNTPLRCVTVTAFGSTRRPDTQAMADASLRAILEAEVATATIVGKSWDFHVTEILRTTLDENLRMIDDTIAYLVSQGLNVIFDAEHAFDGYRGNREFTLATLKTAREAGADVLVLCDTNGGTMPTDVVDIVTAVRAAVGDPIGIHAHNDSGLAVANSVLAVGAGARHLQGTFNGYGERCGNADLCTIIPNLQLKLGLECIPSESLRELTRVSRWVAELANITPNDDQPFVGRNAFTHKAGLHVSAIGRNAGAYEHVDPALVGNAQHTLISDLAGRSNVAAALEPTGLSLDRDDPQTQMVLDAVKQLEHEGYQFEGAEGSFRLLVSRILNVHTNRFELEGFQVITEKRSDGSTWSQATIKVTVGQETVHTAADGNGPVRALDNALRKALQDLYPAIARIRLLDYKVRVIDGRDGTGARVRVLIESGDDRHRWSTVGVSPNIIEASWQALVDSIEYGLLLEPAAGNTEP